MRLSVLCIIACFALSSCNTLSNMGNSLAFWNHKKTAHFNKIVKSKDNEYKLRMAEQYYVKKDYNHAEQLFEELFPIFKASAQFEDLYYKFAYCSFYLRDFTNSENLFKGFVEVFPNSQRTEEMEYMRAYCYYKQSPKAELDQTNTTKTIGFMQAFINTHPGSARIKDATDIIDKCRAKLEQKDYESAQLYYDMSLFKAASITFNSLLLSYPDSQKGDLYKLFVIRADFKYASLSIEEKKEDRFQQVVVDCNDFIDRFPDSKLSKEVQIYLTSSQNNLKTIRNEQVKKTS